jgi:hypothetical protein
MDFGEGKYRTSDSAPLYGLIVIGLAAGIPIVLGAIALAVLL